MIQFFGVALETLLPWLVGTTCLIMGGVFVLALANRIFFKIGVRNIQRRRVQMGLIVFALMLSTTLLSSVLATGDVLTAAVQGVAVYSWGNVDETIEGGHDSLGSYPQKVYTNVLEHSQHSPYIAAVGAALREGNLLVADQNSRQVHSDIIALGILPGSERGFGGMQDVTTGATLTINDLQPYQIYLNQTSARLLSAHVGDMLYLYAERWPGRRYGMQVVGIVGNNGLVGDNATILGRLQTFQEIEGRSDIINIILISNRTNSPAGGEVTLSQRVAAEVKPWLSRHVHVNQVKAQGVASSLKAGDIFSRIFSLFSLFALAIGLLLIFLIFVLLAAERRSEMGMARAIGMQRRHLILMFLFEGAIYDLVSSFIGLLCGLGGGYLLVLSLRPILARFDFPLKFSLQPTSLIVAYCLGVIFTFCSVTIASWFISRITIAEALRDLPEPARSTLSLRELRQRALYLLRRCTDRTVSRSERLRVVRRFLFEFVPEAVMSSLRLLFLSGPLPLVMGWWITEAGVSSGQVLIFSIGISLLILGIVLCGKGLIESIWRLQSQVRAQKLQDGWRTWHTLANGVCAALVGGLIIAYWGLPFDALSDLGITRFQGGIELFFVAGVMMVLGAVWLVMANARLLTWPWLALTARLPGMYAVMRLALAYPLERRFRTAVSVIMFSLVVFAMTIMAVITSAMQQSYVDINQQTGGYDIQATAYFKALPDLQSSLAQHGIAPSTFSAVGQRSNTSVGILQLSAAQPRWYLYPAQLVNGGFLQGYGLHLVSRANGFSDDAAVWQALQSHSNYALIDSSALPANPKSSQYGLSTTAPSGQGNDFDAHYLFSMSGVHQGETSFVPTPVWVTGQQDNQPAIKLTIIGIVDNSDQSHYGLYVPASAKNVSALGQTQDSTSPQVQSYYFKVASGQDVHAVARALGSAYLDNGLETTVLEDSIWQERGPRILLSNVLLGVVGVTLLLGVAALAITGTRAVIERRQQIGMLRALGCSRQMVQSAFLLEAFLVGALGSILGCLLGLLLARNIFAVNFFERYQTGLTFSIPWQQLSLIIGVALLASFLGALLPAWQAGKIAPAEALRYS
ncbi:ABC transporter permease [Tengunoibacter tsumagoiensis]|uniref:ABC3 transporter permease C-terminal domain-containing protein n=1 Tax=Tengunoibacter tsumagoiensis TaxID=2014871 RepID=A0A402A4N8_9CHLR|nr:ABC transporter permease [Tengunoibacter tsumagoiensis]GCE14124.1 hypothetical protein KTT_39830 [Tengunoibacter tsumagoiensis]